VLTRMNNARIRPRWILRSLPGLSWKPLDPDRKMRIVEFVARY
jgi:hypothetical protein